MAKKVAAFLLLLCFLELNSKLAFAADLPYFTFYADKSRIAADDEVRITVNASENGLKENIAAFRLMMHFDSSKLTLKRLETSSQMESGDFQYSVQGGTVIGIYACDGETAPKLLGDAVTFVFKVNKDAIGESIVSAQVDQIVDLNVQKLNAVCSSDVKLQIDLPLSPKALLISLEPLQGKLQPDFTPNISEYSLNLPSSSDSIEFHAAAADGGTVKISRKTLEKPGTKTAIFITVTSADKKSKSQYVVTVNRAENAAVPVVNHVDSATQRPSHAGKTVKKKSAHAALQTDTGSKSIKISEISSMAAGANQGTVNSPSVDTQRNLYVISNQMPAYLVGILGACMCMLVGVFALPFFKNQKLNQENNQNK